MAAAAIGAGASLLSGIIGGKAAKSAAKTQAQAYQQAIGEQQREFNQQQANFAPFLSAGQAALGNDMGVMSILGLNGADAQQKAYDNLKASPAFTSLYKTGQDTILQNAAATGGLRGGNTQNSLAQFGSNLLGTVIQNQLSNLGGLVNIGAGTAGQLGQLGQSNVNAVSNLLTQQGNAQATGALGQAYAGTSTLNDVSKLLQLSQLSKSGGNNAGLSDSIKNALQAVKW